MKTPRLLFGFLLLLSLTPLSSAQEFQRSASGLQHRTIRAGTGPTVQTGQTAVVHEIMKKADGTIVFNSYALNMTPEFELGANQAIKGIDEGVLGMRVGEIRELIVPPALSARKTYPPNLSPNETLHYEVLLVRLKEKKAP